ncbi:hypothetical protein Hanom_Chr08g00701641 [Helianthus anomalus]
MVNYHFALLLGLYGAEYKGKKVIFGPLYTLRMELYDTYIKVITMTFIPFYPCSV